MNQQLILTIGIPASGKDTWAREKQEASFNTYEIVNRDTIRAKDFTESGSIHDYRYTKGKERKVTETQFLLAKLALDKGLSVIVSDTNLSQGTRDKWRAFAVANFLHVEYKVFYTPLHLCIKRNAKRDSFVPESVLIRMETKRREFLGEYVHDKTNEAGLPTCVIFDIDGTLAEMKGRSPYEWSKVGQDTPKEFVCNYLRLLYLQGETIFVFSGRDSVCRPETEKWLKDNNLSGYINHLVMREAGSTTNDTIIKEQMFTEHVKGRYHVTHVFDDRHSVVNMWTSIGFDVMDVGNRISDF